MIVLIVTEIVYCRDFCCQYTISMISSTKIVLAVPRRYNRVCGEHVRGRLGGFERMATTSQKRTILTFSVVAVLVTVLFAAIAIRMFDRLLPHTAERHVSGAAGRKPCILT